MAKVITFSQRFPVNHPKAGKPTGFVEKFMAAHPSIFFEYSLNQFAELNPKIDYRDVASFFIPHIGLANDVSPKRHTIRAGHRFKPGDMFSPRVWSGRPYFSKQIILAPDMIVLKVWNFTISENGIVNIDDQLPMYSCNSQEVLAANDGLSREDFGHWFVPNPAKFKGFDGQIICWDKDLHY